MSIYLDIASRFNRGRSRAIEQRWLPEDPTR
jgi:hypothetical protein